MNRTLAVGTMLAIVLALVGGSAAPIRGAEPAEIFVGSILPLTGGLATTGQGLKLAQELAQFPAAHPRGSVKQQRNVVG